MQIGDRELGYVLDQAARTHVAATGADVAETYEACRVWFAAFKRTIEVWVTYHDPRSLIYRHLIAHLNGKPVDRAPADQRALSFVIAAGRDWTELPTREIYWPDESNEVFAMRGDFGAPYADDQLDETTRRRTLATLQKWS